MPLDYSFRLFKTIYYIIIQESVWANVCDVWMYVTYSLLNSNPWIR